MLLSVSPEHIILSTLPQNTMSIPGGFPGMSGAAGAGDPNDPNAKMVSPTDEKSPFEAEHNRKIGRPDKDLH